MPTIHDIPKMPRPRYRVDMPWDHVEDWLQRWPEFDLDPDFQRAHVWTEEQQIAYIEWIMRGGESGRELHFNHPDWDSRGPGPIYTDAVIVDGKQRLHAVRRFMRGEIPAFGYYRKDWGDRFPMTGPSFSIRICSLQTRAEVLRWYLDFNAGGTAHTEEEINKVRRLLRTEEAKNGEA